MLVNVYDTCPRCGCQADVGHEHNISIEEVQGVWYFMCKCRCCGNCIKSVRLLCPKDSKVNPSG